MRFSKLWFVLLVLVLAISTSQPVFAAPAGRTQLAPVLSAGTKAIPDQYIVVFKGGTAQNIIDAALADANAKGAKVHFNYYKAVKGFAAHLPVQALAALRNNPNVDYVEEDQVITIDMTQSGATWGLDRIDQRNLPLNKTYTYSSTGAGVTAYIIDTGISISHSDFGGRAKVGVDEVGDGQNGIDCNGHGTHVSGTIGGSTYGVAKGVSLVAVRVLNCSGSGTTSGVVAGVDWVSANHQAGQPAVANMSLGGSASTALDNAVRNSINDGVVYAVAAGNDGRDACRTSPARTAEAITVGATDNTDARPRWSNYGSCLDIFAPGVNITSDWLSGGTNTISGTSMATPHVAGVAALYLQTHSGASPSAVRNALIANATAGVVKSAGKNSPNVLLYSNY